jgi:hypothetical protein
LFTIGRHNGAMSNRIQSSTMAIANTFAFNGIEAVPVEVQVQIAPGTPGLVLVGLPDKAVGEARERVRAAFAAMGLSLPLKRVLINLKPADLLKEGSHFDLPLALACSPRWTSCRGRKSPATPPSANCPSTAR